MQQLLQVLMVFITSTLKQFSRETKTFLKKLKCRFSVKSTKTVNATFPSKTVLLETNVKINIKGSTKQTYHKEWSFASELIFWGEILLQFNNLFQRADLI